jgi:hypothetical protein
MKYDDLSFTVKDNKGNDVVCDILSIVPNDENPKEPYVVFTDYMLDENDEFVLQYGKVVEFNDNYILDAVTDPVIVEKIKNGLTDDIVAYVNEQVQENMHE